MRSLPKNRPVRIQVPEFRFFSIEGKGNPNDASFAEYIGMLYSLSYGIGKLYQNLSAPIGAMWEQLYIASSQHYLIDNEENTRGYCCINSEDCLVQIFLLK